MVKKNKQYVKQTVNVKVHIGDSKKQRKRRNYKRKEGVSQGGQSYSASQQPYHPVYIQSGTATDSNPLLQAIQDLNNNIVRTHIEKNQNPLLKTVAEKGTTADFYHSSHYPDESIHSYKSNASTSIPPLIPNDISSFVTAEAGGGAVPRTTWNSLANRIMAKSYIDRAVKNKKAREKYNLDKEK